MVLRKVLNWYIASMLCLCFENEANFLTGNKQNLMCCTYAMNFIFSIVSAKKWCTAILTNWTSQTWTLCQRYDYFSATSDSQERLRKLIVSWKNLLVDILKLIQGEEPFVLFQIIAFSFLEVSNFQVWENMKWFENEIYSGKMFWREKIISEEVFYE